MSRCKCEVDKSVVGLLLLRKVPAKIKCGVLELDPNYSRQLNPPNAVGRRALQPLIIITTTSFLPKRLQISSVA